MSHKHSRDFIKKHSNFKGKVHKVLKSMPLHKYKISRLSDTSEDWPVLISESRCCAYDPSKASKTIRAYLEVQCKTSQLIEKSEKVLVRQEVENEIENIDGESYCNCNQPYSPGELMFKCEGFCGNWYHPHCLKMKVEEVEKQKNSSMRWYCPKCVNKAVEVMIECYDTVPAKSRTTTIG